MHHYDTVTSSSCNGSRRRLSTYLPYEEVLRRTHLHVCAAQQRCERAHKVVEQERVVAGAAVPAIGKHTVCSLRKEKCSGSGQVTYSSSSIAAAEM